MKIKIALLALSSVMSFVQADLKDYWIYPGTSLEQCWNELSNNSTELKANHPLLLATLNFDTYYNCTSREDLEKYKAELTNYTADSFAKDENIRIIKWILLHKATFPKKTTKFPMGITFPFEQEKPLSCDFHTNPCFLNGGGFGAVYSSSDEKYVIKISGTEKSSGKAQNEALREAFNPLISHSDFFTQYIRAFVIKYYGEYEYKHPDGKVVFSGSVFERIKGANFLDYNAKMPTVHCRLLAQAAAGMAMIHEAGCINLDIKPQNMMVNEDGTQLKLIDFDTLVSLIKGFSEIPRTTSVYSAPEGKISPASDVFALGVTILQKAVPFSNELILANERRLIDGDFETEYPYETFVCRVFNNFYLEKTYNEGNKLFVRKPISSKIAFAYAGLNGFKNPAASVFIGCLLQDCLAYEPEKRPSAAQVAEILQIFSAYLEELEEHPETMCPDEEHPKPMCPEYDTVKAMAVKDCPKEIPMALRILLFSPDKEMRGKACDAIFKLVDADSSYIDTPSYGMALLLTKDETFESWAKKHTQALQQFKDRVYIYGDVRPEGRDMPVSKEIYEKVSSM